MSDLTKSVQSRSNVGRDQIGRDQHVTTIHQHVSGVTQLTTWLRQLDIAIASESKDAAGVFIDNLICYVDRREEVDVVGLKAKIESARFPINYQSAISKKQEFAKLLLRYQEFSSAQEIFAHFLAIINDVFDEKIAPKIENMTYEQFIEIVDKNIVEKVWSDLGDGSEYMFININHIKGMIYWLADKCYVKWH